MKKFVVSGNRCETYQQAKVTLALRQVLEPLGGMGAFVKPGQKVLIKPNLLAPHSPEKAITTHPAVVQAVVELVQEQGAKAFIGDSPGGFSILERIEHLWEVTGMKGVAQNTGATLVNFEKSSLREIELKLEKKKIKIFIAECVLKNFDMIINVPKFKTHDLTTMTGAIKNMFGVMPGLTKVSVHKFAPNKNDLSRFLVSLFNQVKPRLNIMDGILGMEGEGPGSSGTPKKTNFLLASENALALDLIAATLMGVNAENSPTIKAGIEANLGPGGIEDIELVGMDLAQLKPSSFILPPTSYTERIPSCLLPIISYLTQFVRLVNPQANPRDCTGCLICLKSCPVQAIQKSGKSVKIDYKKCIECFCCVEMCPEKAMLIKKSLLLRLWS